MGGPDLEDPSLGVQNETATQVTAHFRPRECTAVVALELQILPPWSFLNQWGQWSQAEVLLWGKSGKTDKKGTIQNFLAGKQNFIQNLTMS